MTYDDEVQKINQKKYEEMLGRRSKPPASVAAATPIELTDANFREVVASHPLVVVDFWAPWCGPCRVVSPVLEQLATEMAGRATFGKLNVDDNPVTSQQFGIQGIPTIMVFKDGQPVDGLVGAAPKEMIEARIKPHVGAGAGSPYQ
ncbi:MAG TPA: thioredoxin [Nitrososphaerales archaeon]|nr:thioredoxin [Nitrososphaerales archaeon]